MKYLNILDTACNTPLVQLVNIKTSNTLLVKLEGNNPAGSVKDRPVINMLKNAMNLGLINKYSHLIEATSGNTGIALAFACAALNLKLTIIMPENSTNERKWAVAAYGANLILTSSELGMEGSRDLCAQMLQDGDYINLDQFANLNNPLAHYKSTAAEIWKDTNGEITHFVSSMGTTGTIVGTSKFLKEQNSNIEIIGVQPKNGESIPGIRTWPDEYLPKIYTNENIDKLFYVSADEALKTTRMLAKTEGIFCGLSSGGAVFAMLELAKDLENKTLVSIICDRGDRYLSSGIFVD